MQKRKNSGARNYMNEEKREYASWWMLILALIVVSVIVLGITGQVGRVLDVVFQRQVFEQSYQYDEARDAEIATYNAQLAELEGQFSNPDLTEGQRTNISAQTNAIQVRLNAALERKNNP